jgi:hypothetical protein
MNELALNAENLIQSCSYALATLQSFIQDDPANRVLIETGCKGINGGISSSVSAGFFLLGD